MHRTTIVIAFALAASACSGTRSDARVAVSAVQPADVPAPLTLAADRQDLVFRYVDAAGAVATAARVEDIPAASRRLVVVWDPASPTPAGWDHVVDLTRGLPATAVAQRGFAFPVAAPAQAPATASNKDGAREVFLFSTQGCGYCAQARRFFKSRSVPYTELDVEADANAPAKLGALGRKAGLSSGDLQGVPIIFIDGQPVLGWDQARVARLLGLKG